ncbi:MAG: type IV pilus modification protein PilV [Betaproteobacteria bacterium HGW-Betaproteobacteria-11]|nr:MAG: type IV pilus modification protein PilV [Betaproteobacteria bacterium HGW-Betaproteobacteria-11]
MLIMNRIDQLHCGPSGNGGQKGFSLIEVLISIVIIAISLLGLAGLQARAMNSEFESYQRSQAVLLANDMVERMRMSRTSLGKFKNVSTAAGGGYLGTAGNDSYVVDCASTDAGDVALCEWDSLLKGTAETTGGSKVGAMIGARGCITYDLATELGGIADSGVFTVTVAWQGTQATVGSTSNLCATGLYGNEASRRVVSMAIRLARLS